MYGESGTGLDRREPDAYGNRGSTVDQVIGEMCQEDDKRMTLATIRDMPEPLSNTSSVTLQNCSVSPGNRNGGPWALTRERRTHGDPPE